MIGQRKRSGLLRTGKKSVIGFLLAGWLALIFLRIPLEGQAETADEHRLNRVFFHRLGKDFRSVLESPGRWDREDYLKAAALSGVTLFLFALDQDIQNEIREVRTPSARQAADFLAFFGDGGILLGGLAALYLGGEISQLDSLRRTSLLCLESLVTTTFFIWGGKFLIGRARPLTGESSQSFRPFSLTSRNMSFPSGHAASAFAVATTIAEETDGLAVDILSYSLASLVGIARIVQDKHWASDVLFGSAVGFFVARKITALNRERGVRTAMSIQLGPRSGALSLNLSF